MRGLGMAFSCLLCVGLGFMLIREPATEIVMPAPPLADYQSNAESSQAMATTPGVSDLVNDEAPNATGITAEMSVDTVVAESATISARESAAGNSELNSDSGSVVSNNDSMASSAVIERRSEPMAIELPTSKVAEADRAEEEIAKEVTKAKVAKEELAKESIDSGEAPQVQIIEEQVVEVEPLQSPPALPVTRVPELANRLAPSERAQSDQSQSESPGLNSTQMADTRIAGLENSAEDRADIQAERVDARVSANNRVLAGKSLANRATELPGTVRLVSVAELSELPQDHYTIIIAESDNFQALVRMLNKTELDNATPTMQLVNMAGTDNPPRWLLLYGSYESLQAASDGVRSVREKYRLNIDPAIKSRLSIQQYSTLR